MKRKGKWSNLLSAGILRWGSLALLSAWTASHSIPGQATPFAYISNRDSGTVSVIDTATNIVTANVTVTGSPQGVAVHPAGTFVYATTLGGINGTVSVIDTATNAATATVPVGPGAAGGAFGSFRGGAIGGLIAGFIDAPSNVPLARATSALRGSFGGFFGAGVTQLTTYGLGSVISICPQRCSQ